MIYVQYPAPPLNSTRLLIARYLSLLISALASLILLALSLKQVFLIPLLAICMVLPETSLASPPRDGFDTGKVRITLRITRPTHVTQHTMLDKQSSLCITGSPRIRVNMYTQSTTTNGRGTLLLPTHVFRANPAPDSVRCNGGKGISLTLPQLDSVDMVASGTSHDHLVAVVAAI